MLPLLPSLAEMRERYIERGLPLPRAIEAALRDDKRAGARKILDAVERLRHQRRSEGQRLRHLSRHEQALWQGGCAHIAGVDEAGMSPLAGPVVAAAVILPVGYVREGVDDSKKLRPEQRDELAAHIRRDAICFGVGIVSHEEIDRINIYRAGLLAMRRAVEALRVRPDHLLIDARPLRELPIPQSSIVHGDALSISIAAASIIAKTRRDALMVELDQRYPGWGFARHKGYPVKEHLRAIEKRGVSEVHRRSFAPVRKALGLDPEQGELFAED